MADIYYDGDAELHIAQREAYEQSDWFIDDANEWMQSDAYADLPQALILDLFLQYGPVEDRLAYWLEEGGPL